MDILHNEKNRCTIDYNHVANDEVVFIVSDKVGTLCTILKGTAEKTCKFLASKIILKPDWEAAIYNMMQGERITFTKEQITVYRVW